MKSFNEENLDLFQSLDFHGLLTRLEMLVKDLIKKNELPDRGVIVTPNYGKAENNKGQVISYYIMANEPDYPASDEDLLDKNRHHSSFITLKVPSAKIWKGLVEIQAGTFLLKEFPPPPDSLKVYKQKNKKGEDESGFMKTEDNDQSSDEAYDDRFRIPLDSNSLIEWVRDVLQFKISNYVTAAPSFGCCSRFEECSDAKKCIHPNRMYSTACAYRSNLEAGRIFYGKNRNV